MKSFYDLVVEDMRADDAKKHALSDPYRDSTPPSLPDAIDVLNRLEYVLNNIGSTQPDIWPIVNDLRATGVEVMRQQIANVEIGVEIIANLREQLAAVTAERDRFERACKDLAEVAMSRMSVASQVATETEHQRVTAERDMAFRKLTALQPVLSIIGDWDWEAMGIDGDFSADALERAGYALATAAIQLRPAPEPEKP